MSLPGRLFRILRSEIGDRARDLLEDLEARNGLDGKSPPGNGGGRGPADRGPASSGAAGSGPAEQKDDGRDPRMARWYANLEIPYGSDLATVEAAWKRLARQYHPDRHATDPEKRHTATEILKGINQAHEELKKRLKA